MLIQVGLTTTAASAPNVVIYKKVLGSGTTTPIISNKEIDDVIKMVRFLEDYELLLRGHQRGHQNN